MNSSRRKQVNVVAVILAAGKASRMGDCAQHKLLATFAGRPLVALAAVAAIDSTASSVVVVTGHRRQEIEASLEGMPIQPVYNANFDTGMASSLAAGVSVAASAGADGVLVMLADMPAITSQHVSELIEVFQSTAGTAVVRASCMGRGGNPVILPKSMFGLVSTLAGDVGARQIIESGSTEIINVEIGVASSLDVDTPEAIEKAGGVLQK